MGSVRGYQEQKGWEFMTCPVDNSKLIRVDKWVYFCEICGREYTREDLG